MLESGFLVVVEEALEPPAGYEPEVSIAISVFTEWCNHSATKSKLKASFSGLFISI